MGESTHPFGDRLRQLREAAALTQEELGERAGLTGQAIGALETGKRRRPYPLTLRAIADALELPSHVREELAALASGRSELPAKPAASPMVPEPPTSLIARETDISSVESLLRRRHPRLITLTGPGGVGKTRLALGVISRLDGAFQDGIVLAHLATISDSTLVMPTIALALGIRQSGDRPVSEAVRGYLGSKHLLLMLDNAEHVLPAAPEIAELIASCPNLVVLVTSRAPLRLRGEVEYPVLPLALPDLGEIPTPADVVSADAAKLFVERATSAAPGFELTRANAAAVAAICRRLDGLPLALELAAPWLKVLTPTSLLARLDRSLPLLTGGARDLPERQQTMRDTVAWSYELLDDGQKALFRRLSVFVGGCSLDAIEVVGASPDYRDTDVLDGDAALVDLSLLRSEGRDSVIPRFAMLETIREFGLEQLRACGEEASTRAAHAEWVTNLAVRVGAALERRLEPDMMVAIEAEIANLREALNWLWKSHETTRLLRLSGAVLWPWYLTGQLREGREWAERALAAAPAEQSVDRASAAMAAGHLAHYLGDDSAAAVHMEEALALAKAVDAAVVEAFATVMLGIVAEDSGDYATARHRFETARGLYERADHPRGAALATFHLGIVAYGEGDPIVATSLHEQALSESRSDDDELIEAWCLEWLAVLATERGDLGAAATALARRMEIGVGSHSMPRDGQLMGTAVVLGATCGALDSGARLLGAVKQLHSATGESFRMPERAVYERAAHALRSNLMPGHLEELTTQGSRLADVDIASEIQAVIATAFDKASVLPDAVTRGRHAQSDQR